MKQTDWDSWVTYHADRFGLHSKSDGLWFASVRPLLQNWCLGELRAATDWISSTAEMARQGRNVGLIREYIHRERQALMRAQNEAAERNAQRSECHMCNNSGYVSVPHPRCIIETEWVWPHFTIAAFCRCHIGANKFNKLGAALGEKKVKHGGPELRAVDFEQYEAANPTWREMVRDREAMRKGKDDADYHAKEAGKILPINPMKAVAALAEAKALPVEDCPF